MEVSGADRRQLETWLRSPSTPQELATRARIVLGSADRESIRELAERLDITQRTVFLWRRCYRETGLAGLRILARSGRPRRINAVKEQAVISATLRKPKAATHWSVRRLAREVGLLPATVNRIWQKYQLQPHLVETFKFSTDPEFDRKLTGRKIPDSGARPHPAAAADGRDCPRAALTITRATAPAACSPHWRWPQARSMRAVRQT